MARMNIVVTDELEEKFRGMIFKKYGMKKGNIAKAVGEAIDEWIEREKKKRYANDK